MRRRMIKSTVSAVLIVVILLGVPLAIIDVMRISEAEHAALNQEVQRIGFLLDQQLETSNTPDTDALKKLLAPGHSVKLTYQGHDPIMLGQTITDRPASSGTYYGPAPKHVTAVVTESWSPTMARIRSSLILVVGVAVLATVAACGVAFLQARRLSRPLSDLAQTAERLGSGDPRPRHRRYGIPELDRVAEVIDHTAERISRMLATERRLAADASHQLRTPLTALSMRLEEIIAAQDLMDVKEEAAIALTQVERLTDVVQRLLTDARDSRRSTSTVPIDVDMVIRQQIFEWRPAFRSARRPIRVDGVRGLAAVATPGAFAQVLATLMENSLMHGAGPVTIRTRTTGGSVVVEVCDEGPGVPPELGARVFERSVSGRASTGLGLTVARELAEADGGRLELLQQRPPVFAVFLAAFDPLM
ncbi:MAG TPA: HAMP domain-containing sensor histidine kinase [Actinocrinis sp.]|uniref:sensor histidine kinase n=1 Tax=Actinocrinis sp. TaxID=1920516 RepID=UPI002DDCB50D|nr:HAMP domain-containing sensor histidine kinase [Actinocrinis sp.]HEV2347951.1 HAMP domain-containing sensor histidine kinase [Actinocrinis sp.]